MRRFLSIAIDHGTINSCIATIDENGPRIILVDPKRPKELTMPSAVYYTKDGVRTVGQPARNAIIAGDPAAGEGHTSYKPRIGTKDLFTFNKDTIFDASQLGSIVLSEMLQAAERETGRRPRAAVVTVPAKFPQSAYEGTVRACREAGIEHPILLQEPIAAAMAYGFDRVADDACWIVFDLGGGTLDVTLISQKNGRMEVVDHNGDPDLGGRVFDQELLDYVLGPRKDQPLEWERFRTMDPDYNPLRKQYSLDSFSESRNQGDWGRLMLAVEEAKIVLSKQDEAEVVLSAPLCKDEKGRDVVVEVKVRRDVYEKLIKHHVSNALNYVHQLIYKTRYKPASVILVGGPSKTPFIQKELKKHLQLPLSCEIDPMTAVAIGGAIHAATQDLPEEFWEDTAPAGEHQIKLHLGCPSHSTSAVCACSGIIEADDLDPARLAVRIKRSDGLWESGRLPVGEDGAFSVDLMLVESKSPLLSRFEVLVEDAQGRTLASFKEPDVWHPYVDTPGIKLASDLLVRTLRNSTYPMLPGGSLLPAHGEHTFVLISDLKAGDKNSRLVIEVLESVTNHLGDTNPQADCNIRVGELVISGDMVDDDLPAGSDLEVELKVDKSRQVEVRVYLPGVRKDFDATFSAGELELKHEELAGRYAELGYKLEEVRKLQAQQSMERVAQALQILEDQRVLATLESDLAHGKNGNREALRRAYKGLLRLAGTINTLRDMQLRLRIKQKAKNLNDWVRDEEEVETLRDLETRAANNLEDEEAARQLESELDSLTDTTRFRPVMDVLIRLMAIAEHVKENSGEAARYLEAFLEFKAYLDKISEKYKLMGDGFDLELAKRKCASGEIAQSDLNEARDLVAKWDEKLALRALVAEFLKRQGPIGNRKTIEIDHAK